MQNSCDEKNVVYAGFWVRFAAFLIDSLIVGILTLAARLVLAVSFSVFGLFEVNPLDVEVLFTYTVKDIILYLLGAAYYIICTYCAGTTAGKRLFNLRVVPAETKDGEKLRLFDVVYRETIGKFLSGVIMNIGYIIAGIDSEKRALHDILCDTRVIYAKRVKVIPVRTGHQQYTMYGGPAPQNQNPGGPWNAPWPQSASGRGSMTGSQPAPGYGSMPGVQNHENSQNVQNVQDAATAQNTPEVRRVSGMPYTPEVPDAPEGQQVTEPQSASNLQEMSEAERTSEKNGESRTAVQDTDSTGI